MPTATLLYKYRYDYEDGMILEVVIWKLPEPVQGSQHCFKYRCFYGNAKHGRMIGYDNERPKGDHRHYGHVEKRYTFVTPDQLINDFLADVQQQRSQHNANINN
ncbi:MAG: toxin-antitoxin system TumE family protein [bacterium]